MQNALQPITKIDEVNPVAVAIFDGAQPANIRVAFTGQKDQGLLAPAVKKPGFLPSTCEVVVRRFEMDGIKGTATKSKHQPLAISVLQKDAAPVHGVEQPLRPVTHPLAAEDSFYLQLSGVASGQPQGENACVLQVGAIVSVIACGKING